MYIYTYYWYWHVFIHIWFVQTYDMYVYSIYDMYVFIFIFICMVKIIYIHIKGIHSHIATIWYITHIDMYIYIAYTIVFFYQGIRPPLWSSHSRCLHCAKACQDAPLFDFLEVHLFARPVKGRGLTEGVFVDALFGRNPFSHSSQL